MRNNICDSLSNLALACDRCNFHKGPNLSSIDPLTGTVVSLFHPRLDQWYEHFKFEESEIVGTSPVGRATAQLLQMNAIRRIELRTEWLLSGGTFGGQV